MNLPDPYPVHPVEAFRVSISPPGSKSLTNRALLLAALAEGESTLRNPLVADDTQRMLDALISLGVKITPLDDGIRVTGVEGRFPGNGELQLGNAGTATRFLTAAACFASGPVVIDGDERMRCRPIGELVDQLLAIGANVEYRGNIGCPPLRVTPTMGNLRGGEITIPTTLSSQFVSALLQIAPLCDQGLKINLTGPVTSMGYIRMTIALMRRFGSEVTVEDEGRKITVAPGGYRGIDYFIEPDASSATYFLAAAAITPGACCTIEGLGKGSTQSDVGFADKLAAMGAGLTFGEDFITVTGTADGLRGIDTDMSLMPDAALTLAVTACFAQGQTVIHGLRTLRVKETDRLAALEAELSKLGVKVTIEADGPDEMLIIDPADFQSVENESETGGDSNAVVIDTYKDHRMAMAFAVIGLRRRNVSIADPACVNKTYPGFWDDLSRLS